jgi:ATP adenylyltransferase
MSGEAAGGRLVLERGTLWGLVLERTVHAVGCGALEFFPTERELIEQGGVAFMVRVLASLERKQKTRSSRQRGGANPFLPYEEDLFVGEISDTHRCLLNKFNAVEHHVLIVTRAFEEQESLLDLRDFEALWACMAEFDAVAFYNAGLVAGASQRHKHIQLVPVPLGFGPERTPIDSLLASARFSGPVGTLPQLPFVHALAWAGECAGLPTHEAARASLAIYGDLRRAVGIDREPRPYNLLVTREWMLLVPRTREAYREIPVNALGFAGSLLVRNREQLAFVQECGPLTILQKVALGHGARPDA